MKRALPAVTATALLLGCAPSEQVPRWANEDNWEPSRAARPLSAPQDDVRAPYFQALRDGYRTVAERERDSFDWWDARRLIDKAQAASEARPVPLFEAPLPGETGDALAAAAAELNRYIFAPGAQKRAALQIGEAQVLYDDWYQEAEDDNDADLIAARRDEFEAFMILLRLSADLPGNLAVVLPKDGETGGIEITRAGETVVLDTPYAAAGTDPDRFGDVQVEEGEIRDAFADARAAAPPPSRWFCVSFPFEGTRITDDNFGPVLEAALEVRRRAAAEVLITGQADALGTRQVNQTLSRLRADAVRSSLLRQLQDAQDTIFSVKAVGERKLNLPDEGCPGTERRVIIQVR